MRTIYFVDNLSTFGTNRAFFTREEAEVEWRESLVKMLDWLVEFAHTHSFSEAEEGKRLSLIQMIQYSINKLTTLDSSKLLEASVHVNATYNYYASITGDIPFYISQIRDLLLEE